MERVVSPEERMRRAEEIYYRRKAQGVRVSTTSVNVGKSQKVSLGKKMMIQILICIAIYSLFLVLKNHNSIFSEKVINQTKTVLSYDVNFQKMYNQGVEYFKNNFNNIVKVNELSNDENKDESNEIKDDNNVGSDAENQGKQQEVNNENQGESNLEVQDNQANTNQNDEQNRSRRWNRHISNKW